MHQDPVKPLIQRWCCGLSGLRARVVLTDGDDPRVVSAAVRLARSTPVQPVLITDSAVPDGVEVLHPSSSLRDPVVTERLRRALVSHRVSPLEMLAGNPLYVGAAAVKAGLADACVGGTAPEALSTGLRVLGLGTGVMSVTSCFLLAFHDGRQYAYGDCVVIPEPTAEELADIGFSTSRTFAELTGDSPVVAMLSFSARGGVAHPSAQRVRTAAKLVQGRSPGLAIDEGLPFDAVIAASLATHRVPGRLAGKANVFVFPNLDAGRIAYRMTSRLGQASVVGPVLQGLAGVLNHLPPDHSADDVFLLALASAVRSVHHGPLRRAASAARFLR